MIKIADYLKLNLLPIDRTSMCGTSRRRCASLCGKAILGPAGHVGESRKEWMLKIFSDAGKKNSNNSEYQFWRQDNHPIEVWSEDVIHQKLLYLHNNPVMEGFVANAEEYLFSSARDYYNDKNCGLLEIKFITD